MGPVTGVVEGKMMPFRRLAAGVRALGLTCVLSSVIAMAGAQQRPSEPPPVLSLGNAVVTGFSGVAAPDPRTPRAANRSIADLTFINPDGASARVIDLSNPGFVWDGRFWPAPTTREVLARDTGQVFGVALDDEAAPNIYLAATSLFGLHIVRRLPNGTFERLRSGGPGAQWQNGQFGLALQGGPGSIYKVDGRTGEVSLLANVLREGVPNPGPALGNLAYHAGHKQLFVSDLHTGMVHRIAAGDGAELGAPFDHGVTGRNAARLQPVPFDARTRVSITNARFDPTNPETWGFAPPERRVWGLAVHESRLYYSVRNGSPTEAPQVWSVGIQPDGSFGTDPRWELDVPAPPGPYAVSDIAFSRRGAMILAQRAPIAGSYEYAAFTKPGEPRVLRFSLESPDDPRTPGRWLPGPEEYPVGFAEEFRNTNGGVALGYGYTREGRLSIGACEYALWTTGQNLRRNPVLQSRLDPGGPALVNGLFGIPSEAVRVPNEAPWLSYSVDYDNRFDDPAAAGHLGSVRILTTPCSPIAAYGGPGARLDPPYVSNPSGEDGCRSPSCAPCEFGTNPDGTCKPWTTPVDLAIKKSVETKPGPDGATYTFTLTITNTGAPFNAPAGVISVTDIAPAGVTFTTVSASAGWTCSPAVVTPGNPLNCNYAGGLVPTGVVGTVSITATGTPPFTNCASVGIAAGHGLHDSKPDNNKDCVDAKKPDAPVEVAIKKSGEIGEPSDGGAPAGTSAVFYSLDITNVGAGFAGANAITVTDVVPANMTYTAITAPSNWTCLPNTPLMAGATLTCTYTGNGPAAPGDFLGSIKITATASGDGPWENCANVGIAAGTGTDANLNDNKSCKTLTKDGFDKPDDPPPIPKVCGVNVIFVVDKSGSIILPTNYTTNITSALSSAASIFNVNGSKAAVIHFNDNASVVQPLATATYTNVNLGYAAPPPSGGTNWEAALKTALGLLPSPNTVVVFITDGVPTAYLDNANAVQYTTNPVLATNEAIPVVNQIYAQGVPIIGIGIGVSTHLNALLGGNAHTTTYGGLNGVLTNIAADLCPTLKLSKSMSPGTVDFSAPGPHQVTVTLTVNNLSATSLTNVVVQDALPPELISPGPFTPAQATTSGNVVTWTIPTLAGNGSATLNFPVTVSPSGPLPANGACMFIKNFAQVWSVGGGTVAGAANHMANPVTGPVHEPDEASAQICARSAVPTLSKTMSPTQINYFNNPGPHQTTITLTFTNPGAALTGVVIQDALPPELTNPGPFTPMQATASGNVVTWTIPTVGAGATVTLSFPVTVAPANPPPTNGSWYCIKNYAQLWSVAGGNVPSASNHMTNAVTGPVHEPDESMAQVCVRNYEPPPPTCSLWVKKSIPYEVCRPGAPDSGNPCKFTITVTAISCPFNGPVRLGEGVFSGSTAVSAPITSITAVPPTPCTWGGTTPTSCVANVSLNTGSSITFTVTLGTPLPNGSYRNCFLAAGMNPVPADFNAAYSQINPTTAANGGLWGSCTPFIVANAQGMVVCPPGTSRRGGECTTPPRTVCASPLVPGSVAGQCVCPQGTELQVRNQRRQCVPTPACRPPMVTNEAGICVCPAGTTQRGRECVPAAVCRAPMVANARGTACVCPPGLVQRGRECVRSIECRPPAQANRAGTACVCPRGMIARGRECVPERVGPRLDVPGIRSPITRTPGGEGPRGGDVPRRGGDVPRGGGGPAGIR